MMTLAQILQLLEVQRGGSVLLEVKTKADCVQPYQHRSVVFLIKPRVRMDFAMMEQAVGMI